MTKTMRKVIFLIFITIIISACRKTPQLPFKDVPNDLKITNSVGIKLETPFVTSEVSMNVKLNNSGNVTIRIFNIENRVVSKETLFANSGNNILKVYTNALPPSAYRIALYDKDDNMLGITDFNKL